MLLIENVCKSYRKIIAPKSLGSFTILDRFFKKCIFYLAHNCLIVRFANTRDFSELMHVVSTHIEAIFTEVIVLAFETVEAFASNGFILRWALVAEILLGKLLINLEAVWLSNFITQSHCFRGGLGQDLNWLLPGVIGSRHANGYVPKITVIFWTVIHLAWPHPMQSLFDKILSELHHRMWTIDPSISSTFLAVGFLPQVVKARKAGEPIRGRYFSKVFCLMMFWLGESMCLAVQHIYLM